MSTISQFHLDSQYFEVLQLIQQLASATNLLSFYSLLNQIRKLCSDIDCSVRTQTNSFGMILPHSLLIHCLTFLGRLSYTNCRIICKNWRTALTSVMAETRLGQRVLLDYFSTYRSNSPEHYFLIDTIKRNHITPEKIIHEMRINSLYVFLLDAPAQKKIDIYAKKDLIFQKTFSCEEKIYTFEVSDTSIACEFQDNFSVFNLENEALVRRVPSPDTKPFALDNSFFYLLNTDMLARYSLDLKKSRNDRNT